MLLSTWFNYSSNLSCSESILSLKAKPQRSVILMQLLEKALIHQQQASSSFCCSSVSAVWQSVIAPHWDLHAHVYNSCHSVPQAAAHHASEQEDSPRVSSKLTLISPVQKLSRNQLLRIFVEDSFGRRVKFIWFRNKNMNGKYIQ